MEGRFDPTSLIKGWAAEVVAKMLDENDVESVLINTAGEWVLRGVSRLMTLTLSCGVWGFLALMI